MLPTQTTPKKQDLADLTVLAYGHSKIGKCLMGDTQLIDAHSGRPVSLRDLVAKGAGDVLTMREAGLLVAERPHAYLTNEPEQLCRLTTQTGRTIEATASHPFLTREGWKPLEQLTVSDRVAVVAEYPNLFGHGGTDDELIKILAYLIADGSLANDSSPVFTKVDPEVRMDFEAAVEAKGDECVEFTNEAGVAHVRVRGRSGSRNNVIAHLKEVGLHGLRSGEKFVPDFVFGLEKRKLRLFLNRLFTCDGSVEASGRVSYSSTSVRMVREIQHLLLRFGIVSVMRERSLHGEPYGAEILIASKANVLAYLDQIGFIGEKAVRAEAVRQALYQVRGAETQLDRVGPILFDRVVRIEPTVVEPVYDLTMDESHNFVANDFIVHNSTWCAHSDGALFLATEPGLNALDVYQVPIQSWDQLLAACGEIAEGKHPFKTIILDTVDNAYRMCSDHVCAKFKIEHESDLGYGKGWALINNEFHRVLTKLAFLPYGLFLVSHSVEREIETRTGKYTRIVPTLPDKARKIVLGMVDLILYCDLDAVTDDEGETSYRRVMRTKPSPHYEAGDRMGRLPETIDLDFAKFTEAFNRPAAKGAAQAAKPAAASKTGASRSASPAASATAPGDASDQKPKPTTSRNGG